MLSYPVIDPIIVSIGPFVIRWYSMAYVLGLILPFVVFLTTFRKKIGMDTDDMITFSTYLVLGMILGGRIGYVLFYDLMYYVAHPGRILAIWQGGMSYHGGAIGVVMATYVYARHAKKQLWQLWDIVALGSTIGLFFGRIANFINGELVGTVTRYPLGMIFPGAGPFPRHPSQLYEAFFEGIVLFIGLLMMRRYCSLRPGQLAGLYLIGYSTMRFLIEFTREPDSQLGYLWAGLSAGQWLCLVQALVGVLVYCNRHVKYH